MDNPFSTKQTTWIVLLALGVVVVGAVIGRRLPTAGPSVNLTPPNSNPPTTKRGK